MMNEAKHVKSALAMAGVPNKRFRSNSLSDSDKILLAMKYGLVKPGDYWAGHHEFPGYMFSADGDVITLKKRIARRMNPSKTGVYRTIRIKDRGGKYRTCYVHRLLSEIFNGPCPEGMECRHLDGDPENNNCNNVKWGTRLENARDRVVHGTSGKGEGNTMAVLNEGAVRKMRAIRADTGKSAKNIAKMFGVSTMTAHRAITGQSWSHVK